MTEAGLVRAFPGLRIETWGTQHDGEVGFWEPDSVTLSPMSQRRKAQKLRGRKDHWLPQGYLRGFIAPSRANEPKPLSCFDRHEQKWKSVSPREIAFGMGFYDYASGTDYSTATHPDSAFARLEREFPQRREQMAASNFETWGGHKDFLLEFMQMMRARSPLAMKEQEAEARKIRASTITSVSPDRRSVTVDSLELRPLPERGVRNFTISRMLQDVQNGIAWASNLDWCLRYTDDESDPFCTTNQALFVEGSVADVSTVADIGIDLLFHPDTVVFFPLCWQSCIFGSPRKFEISYDRADPRQLVSLRNTQKQRANRFVISPKAF